LSATARARCEIRQLLVHTYPGGHKAADVERVTIFYGRRGRLGKKSRRIPAKLIYFWACKLQARKVGTASVF
jgi:hypothetical protein